MSRLPAVPSYVTEVAKNFDAAAPGHRFNLYCSIWERDWTIAREDGAKAKAVAACAGKFPDAVDKLLQALRERQRMLASCFENAQLHPAISTAPFATGLGNEHPVENGFAFLSPYGLPYLPGSSVKGVLRRAAEELAVLGDPDSGAPADIDLLDAWWLFGFEGERGLLQDLATSLDVELSAALDRISQRPDLLSFISRISGLESFSRENLGTPQEPQQFVQRLNEYAFRRTLSLRGALAFWDVFPEPKGKALSSEIVTPHFDEYYQGKSSPHDAGQPRPIPFLVLPAGSKFDFHVVCDLTRLPDRLQGNWEALLTRIFTHAFDWLGFGAKTAVGYGQMARDVKALQEHEKQIAQQRGAREREESLQRAVAGLPEDAAWVEQRRLEGGFEDSGRLLDTVELWVASRDALTPQAWSKLSAALDDRWKGIMDNPDATQGKKNKPKFKPRPVALAKRLLELRPDH